MTLLEERFNCKEREYLTKEAALDYLGMLISMDEDAVYLSMEKYIDNACEILNITDGKTRDTPITKPIIAEESTPLTPDQIKTFLTGNGMLGWLAQTVRADVAYTYSRIAQHSAKPTQAAMDAVIHAFRYLSGTRDLALVAPINPQSRDIMDFHLPPPDPETAWRFFTDADHAGNAETQNDRRSQNGCISLLNGFPTLWESKASSVCFASPLIGEAHADMSSTAVEVYSAGNATMTFMGHGYVASEMRVPFPIPFTLEIDNTAAIIFANGTAAKSKLKHIDTRQSWVKTLRNRNILKVAHVPSAHNLADLFTKILPKATFTQLRDQIFKPLPSKMRAQHK